MEIQRLADAGRVHVAGGWSLVATPWMSLKKNSNHFIIVHLAGEEDIIQQKELSRVS